MSENTLKNTDQLIEEEKKRKEKLKSEGKDEEEQQVRVA